MSALDFKTYTIPANGRREFSLGGDYLKLRSATAEFKVIHSSGATLAADENFEFSNYPYTRLTFLNESGTDIEIEFYHGEGAGRIDNNTVALSGTVKTSQQSGGTITTPAHVSVAGSTTDSIASANASRKEIMIRNKPSNTHDIIIGDSNAGASRGITLTSGEAVTLTTTAQIYAYNTKTGAQDIEVLEIE